jgi:predicted dienelactone hydrolase
MRIQLRNVVLVWAIVSSGQAHAADWNVGLKHLTLPDPVSGASMTGIVTYPTMAPATRLKIGRFETVAAENAPAPAGKFPLIIFSHGTGALPEFYLWLFEGLSAKGFIVAGVAHSKDNYNDRTGSFGDSLLIDRARHVSALIDNIEQDATLGQSIVTKKIGVIGHSAGGYAALLSAGGTPDFSQFVRGRCDRDAELGSDRPRFVHNSSTSNTPDDRIRAVAAMAPALGCLFDRKALDGIHVPVRLYQADNDEILQPGYNSSYLAPLFEQAPEVFRIANAGHFVFLNTCPFIMSLIARQICRDPWGVDRDDIHRRIIEDSAKFFARTMDASLP